MRPSQPEPEEERQPEPEEASSEQPSQPESNDQEPDAPQGDSPVERPGDAAANESGGSEEPKTTQVPEPVAIEQAEAKKDLGWAELVAAQHGTIRPSEPEAGPVESGPSEDEHEAEAPKADQTVEQVPEAGAAGAEEASALRSEIANASDEVNATMGSLVEELRDSIRGTSESAHAEAGRLADELHSRIKRVEGDLSSRVAGISDQVGQIEDDLGSRVAGISDQVGRIEDRIVRSLDQLTETAAALRERLEKVESASGRLKEDIQDLALRIERGLAESADRFASLDTTFQSAMDHIDEQPEVTTEQTTEPPKGPIRINEVTFEQLRSLGFSVTQSARVVAYRDTHGGFTDLDQLREVRGLSNDDLRLLSERSTI